LVSTRNSSNKKRKKLIDVATISYKSTCIDLELVSSLTCVVCTRKKKDDKLVKKGRIQQTNFRCKSKKNRCEQRWSDEYISYIHSI